MIVKGGETGIRVLKIAAVNPFHSLPCCATDLYYLIKVEAYFKYILLSWKVRCGSGGLQGDLGSLILDDFWSQDSWRRPQWGLGTQRSRPWGRPRSHGKERCSGCTQSQGFFMPFSVKSSPGIAVGFRFAGCVRSIVRILSVSLAKVKCYCTGIPPGWFSVGQRLSV